MVKDSKHPSKYFPSDIVRVTIHQNFPPFKILCYTVALFRFHSYVLSLIIATCLVLPMYTPVGAKTKHFLNKLTNKLLMHGKVIEGKL